MLKLVINWWLLGCYTCRETTSVFGILNNTNNAYDNGINIWNITPTLRTNTVRGSWLGGNYWCDYAGADLDGDGLGDTLLPYNSSGNITTGGDWHPLVPVGADVVVFRGGTWYVDTTGDYTWDYSFLFGLTPGDVPVVGEINQDGRYDTAIFRSGMWYLDYDGDCQWDDSFQFGLAPGDVPLVGDINDFAIEVNKTVRDNKTGEWVDVIRANVSDIVRFKIWVHNDGACSKQTNVTVNDTLSASLEYAAGTVTVNGMSCEPEEVSGQLLKWYYNASRPCTSPFKNLSYGQNITIEFNATKNMTGDDTNCVNVSVWYNETGSHVQVFDEDCAGVREKRDDTAIFRGGTWYVDYDGDHVWGPPSFQFGLVPGDVPDVGDINQDGDDDTAIFRGGTWYVDYDGDHVWGPPSFQFGLVPGDVPIVGDIR